MTNKAVSEPEAAGSFRSSSFEHALVADAMRPGVFSCSADTPVRTVAQMMTQHHIHSVVVTDIEAGNGEHAWGIVSDTDMLHAVDSGAVEESAGAIAATEFLAVDAEETLAEAVHLMAEHEVTHLVVCQDGEGRPVGVISTLDVAGVIAWGRA